MSTINEKRPGYKKTKVGWIPEEWGIKKIIDSYSICNYLRKPISTDVRKNMKGNYPYYGPTRILDYIDHYQVEGTYTLIGEDGDHFLKYNQKQQTQLIEGKNNVNNHAHIVKGTESYSTEWFFWFFHHRNIIPFLSRQGANRYKLNKEELSKLLLALPPFPEQKKIAEILSTWDKSIEKLEKLIELKEKRKKGLMQQLLTGKKRLSGFGKPVIKDGDVPEGWELKRLRDICTIDKENLSVSTPENYTFHYISLSDVNKGNLNKNLIQTTFKDAPSRARRIIKPGDTLLSTVRPNLLGFVHLKAIDSNTVASTGFAVLTPKEKTDPEYIGHYAFSYHIISQINALVVGSNYPAVNSSDVRVLKILIPKLSEQKAISSILSSADNELKLFLNNKILFKKMKKGLMQKLLTGEVRVRIDEVVS